MMGRALLIAVCLCLFSAAPSMAQQAEAKQTAQSANCKPSKLEVIRQVTGRLAETVYKVSCANVKDGFVLVLCRDRTCTLMH